MDAHSAMSDVPVSVTSGYSTSSAPSAGAPPPPIYGSAGPSSAPASLAQGSRLTVASTGSSGPPTNPQQQQQQLQQQAVAADAQRQAQWAELVQRLSASELDLRLRALDDLNYVCASPRCVNYLLTKLKLLDRVVPMLTTAAGSQSQQIPPDFPILDRCCNLLAQCAWQQWEDRHKAELLFSYPGLVERLAYVYTRHVRPESQALAARALWNLAWKNEALRTHAVLQQVLLQSTMGHLSSKSVPLRKMSMGLLWSLCDGNSAGAKQCVSLVVEKLDGVRLVMQCLGSNDPAFADSESYFLLLSLLHALLNQHHPAGRRAKADALSMGAVSSLLPLLTRTTSTTLMDRICDVLALLLFNQSKEQMNFASKGGVLSLSKALHNPALQKCQQRILMTTLAALYRNPYWVNPVFVNRPEGTQLAQHVQPVFDTLASRFVELQNSQPCQVINLAIGLTLATITHARPALADALVERGVMAPLARLLTPPSHFPASDCNTIVHLGLVVLLQIAYQNASVQQFLLHENFGTPTPPPGAAPSSAASAPSTAPAVPTSAQGLYGNIFQYLLNCVSSASPTTVSLQRVQAVRLIGCILECDHDRRVSALLLDGHENFLSHVLDALKLSYPNRMQPTMRDDAPLVHLASALFVLCGGPAVPNKSASKLGEQPAVQANFQKLTQKLNEDPKLGDALVKIHKQIVQHQQLMQQQQQLQQQQQAAAAAAAAAQAAAQGASTSSSTSGQSRPHSSHPPAQAPNPSVSPVSTASSGLGASGQGAGQGTGLTSSVAGAMQTLGNLKPLPPSMPPMQQQAMQGTNNHAAAAAAAAAAANMRAMAAQSSPPPPSVPAPQQPPPPSQQSPPAAPPSVLLSQMSSLLSGMQLPFPSPPSTTVPLNFAQSMSPQPPLPNSSPRQLTETEKLALAYQKHRQ